MWMSWHVTFRVTILRNFFPRDEIGTHATLSFSPCGLLQKRCKRALVHVSLTTTETQGSPDSHISQVTRPAIHVIYMSRYKTFSSTNLLQLSFPPDHIFTLITLRKTEIMNDKFVAQAFLDLLGILKTTNSWPLNCGDSCLKNLQDKFY